MDSQHHPGHIMSIYLRLRQEIAAVDQAESNSLSLRFIGVRTFQHDKRIVLMGGISSSAVHRLDALFQSPYL